VATAIQNSYVIVAPALARWAQRAMNHPCQNLESMALIHHLTQLAQNIRDARGIVALAPAPRYPQREPAAPVVALLSPHPDDECIVGGLALRLGVESGWRVVNLAVTLGSNPARQLPRAQELRGACEYLGFECEMFGERGLENISPAARATNSAQWQASVAALRQKLTTLQPALILAPHPHDAHAAHVGTYWLMRDALATLPKSYAPFVALTEYWSTMETPNLMLALGVEEVAQLVSGLLHHQGEIARNPYHATLPLWMMENVRRGSERVGAPGGVGAEFDFATLYCVLRWRDGALTPAWSGGKIIGPNALPSTCFFE
jgi:N-acetylglucosamine malate deacetylase 1